MKPMRKADLVLMRRMDLQSLHSSLDADSSIISRGISPPSVRAGLYTSMTLGLLTGLPRAKTPQQAHERPEDGVFDTFTQLSSPPKTHSPQKLPALPGLDSMIGQVGQELSAVAEIFERVQGHEAYQRLSLPSRPRSPMHRPLSDSSDSSQEVVEQQLTPEDDAGPRSRPPLPPQLPNESEHVDVELRWPTDDESDVPTTEMIQNSEQSVPEQNHLPDSSPDSARGKNFRCASLNVPLAVDSQGASTPHTSQGSHSQSQPIILQTQAPYSSQTTQ